MVRSRVVITTRLLKGSPYKSRRGGRSRESPRDPTALTIRRKASSTRHSFDQSFWSRRGGPRKFTGACQVFRQSASSAVSSFRFACLGPYAASPTSAPRARARAHKACVHPQIFQIGHRSSMVERSSGSHGPLQRLPQSLFTGRVYHTSFAVRVDAGSNPADDNFFFLCFLCFLFPPPQFGRCHFDKKS